MAQNKRNRGATSATKEKSKGSTKQPSRNARGDISSSSISGWKLFSIGLLVALAAAISANYWPKYLSKSTILDSPQNESHHDLPFFVVEIPGKGKGAIASRDIKQGELVLREKPLFLVDLHITSSPIALIAEKLAPLTPQQRAAFDNLSYVNFNLNPDEHPGAVALAKFETNAVAAGREQVGIFPNMARLNHGCSSAFNVVYSWREEEQALVVYALKEVKKGQELLTTYLDSKKPREERRAFLNRHYGFHCTCAVCSLPNELSKASDDRLSKIKSLYGTFATWGNDDIDGVQAIQAIRDIWAIEDEEGYWSERGSLAFDATWIAASHSDVVATQAWARKGVEWFSYEIGSDTTQVQSLLMVIAQPQAHKAWGSRNALIVGGPEPSPAVVP